ncbi:hypothetical protein Tco_0737899, partial [Tanacetum coccineum]
MRETESLNYGMNFDTYPYLSLSLKQKDTTNLNHRWLRYLLKPYSVGAVGICSCHMDIYTARNTDYVVELQSTNPNTIIKITVEGNTDPFLPTRVFQRIHVCLGALKFGLRACRRNLLGLDGSFMKGPFPSQVLAAVGLDSNNGIYPLVYALVEPE